MKRLRRRNGARTAAGWLFIGVDLLLHRWFGAGSNKALLIMIYFLACTFSCLPGAALAIALFQVAFLPLSVCVLAMVGLNLLLALLLLYLSRNILSASEFNNK